MKIGLDISVLASKQKTGIALYTYHLIDALLKINRKDQFILFGIADFDSYDFLRNIKFKKNPNVEIKIFKLPKKAFRSTFLFWQKIGLPKIEHLIGPVDIFHSFNWFLPPQKKGKIVATVFDLTPKLYPQFHQAKTVQLEETRLKRIAKFADLVVTISQNSKKDFLKFFPNLWVEVIYPAVAKEFSKKGRQVKRDQILKKYGLEPNFILFAGTIEPRKNIPFLIDAYLNSKISNQLVLVGGKGWEYQSILDLINLSKIKWLDFVPNEDLPILYQSCYSFVYPSFYEGFGLPVLEALSSKTAVITSNTSSLPEVGGDALLYVDPTNIDDIAKKLKLLANDKKLRENLAKLGISQAKKFSWIKSAKKLNILYQQLNTVDQ